MMYFTPTVNWDDPFQGTTTTSEPSPSPSVPSNTTVPPASSSSSTSTVLPPTTTSSSSQLPLPPTTTSTTSQVPLQPQTTPPESTTPLPSTTVALATSTPEHIATTEVHVTVTPSPNQVPSGSLPAASPTESSTSKSLSTGVMIGGIIAAVVAVAGIAFLVVYFVRRSRSVKDEESSDDAFNPDLWRRQSTMLPDDGPSGISRAMNFSRNGVRPPTMIEQKLAGGGVSFNAPPVPPHPYGYGGYNTFSPGQVVDPYTPTTMNSANPFFSPYGEPRVGTPVSMHTYYDAQGHAISRQPSVASTAVLSRHTSVGSKEPSGDGQYVDMSRSSVTPFQAAQYAEISRRLNSTPPQPLPLAAVTEELEHPQEIEVPAQRKVEPLEFQPTTSFDEGHRLNVQPTPREHSFPESPYADPTMVAEQQQHIPQRDSMDSMLQPPEPPKSRITSIPPMLPEIQLQERPFSPVTLDFPIAPSSVRPSPSPFSTTFDIPSPPPYAHFPVTPERPDPQPAPEAAPRAPVGPAPAAKRPETVYDEEDAYAGI